MGWFVFIAVGIALFLLLANWGGKLQEESKEKRRRLVADGFEFNNAVYLGKFIGGHPNLSVDQDYCVGVKKNADLKIIIDGSSQGVSIGPTALSRIPLNAIEEIEVLDKTEIEKRVTLGRVLLVGIFALAWKKDKAKEAAYLNIVWREGRFKHETLFLQNGASAFQKANKARNELIKIIN